MQLSVDNKKMHILFVIPIYMMFVFEREKLQCDMTRLKSTFRIQRI